MSAKTTIVLLVLVAVGCLVVVALDQGWFGREADEKPQNQFAEPFQAEPESKDLFEDHPAEVTRLTIESEDLAATFAKTDDQWEIVEPIKAPALKWEVDGLVRTVTGLRYTRKFEPGQPDAPSEAETGLSDPKVKVTIEYENGLATLEVGKKELLRDNTYVRLAGKPEVYVAQSNLEPTFDKKLKDFREKDLLSFKFGDAVGLEIVSREPARTLKLTKEGDREWVMDSPMKARASREGASDLITVLNEMKAEEFVDDAPQDLSRYGLDEPFARVTLTTRSEVKPEEPTEEDQATTQPTTQPQYETKEWTILIGSFVGLQEERRHAKLGDSTAVVAVDARSANKLLPDLLEVRDKRITPANTFKINKLVVAGRTESVTLEKEGDRWRIIAPEAAEADKGKVDEVIRAIRGLQAVSFVDSPDDLGSFGLAEPRVELKLYVTGQVEPEIIRVGRRSPSGRMLYVQRGGEESVSVVKADEAEKLLVSPVSFGPRRILSVPLAQIRQIELTRDQTRMVLAKKTDRWRIYEPYEATADESGVARILSDVASLRAREIVARGQFEAFGLDQPDIEVVVEVSPPTPPTTSPAATQPVEQKPERHRLLVSRQDDQVYAVMEGGDLVYQLDPAVYEHLSAELHDRKVLRFSPNQVERLEISGSEIEQKLVLARIDDAWAYPADEFFQLDDQKVQRRVQDLRGIEALRFVDLQATDPGQYGLDEPAVQVELALADGKSLSLRVSARGPDGGPQRYAIVADEPKVFVLRGEDVAKLRVTLGDFEKD
ncbi:MAG TPA: DUF4340 domain-containing protein [Phycisphaerae bacterium]|nr:DUF4340 domain-containing protein [Phycisphaerae bacterium]